eukprot:GHRR01030843.1.p1 GENE.GHRR01030843.1~~GHRR01030843.1.p1  ORF type:complete len:120 (-),score=19.72 GHRR01030843.1:137-496(-)
MCNIQRVLSVDTLSTQPAHSQHNFSYVPVAYYPALERIQDAAMQLSCVTCRPSWAVLALAQVKHHRRHPYNRGILHKTHGDNLFHLAPVTLQSLLSSCAVGHLPLLAARLPSSVSQMYC